tara:strand:+ start:717 stop:1073 length:357 start_codon:yes stop_codon:yes gene_type:complete
MNNLETIKENIKKLSSIPLLKDKIKTMKKIKEDITNEQKEVDKIVKRINNFKSKEIEKYKKNTIDELQGLFDETDNFNDKLEIYSQLCFKINEVEKELFGEIKDTDTEDIEFESDSDD